jgi:hypothetical protein
MARNYSFMKAGKTGPAFYHVIDPGIAKGNALLTVVPP